MARKDLDGLTKVVEPYGGKGVAFFKIDGEELSGGISKFISPEQLTVFKERQTEQKGIWLFSADINTLFLMLALMLLEDT